MIAVVLVMNIGACSDGAPSGDNSAGGSPGGGGQSVGGSSGTADAGPSGAGGSGGKTPGTGGSSGGGSSGGAGDAGPTGTGGASIDGSSGAAGASGVRDGGPPGADGGPSPGGIVPLFDATTKLEREVLFDRGDAIVTRFGDRGRDRHAREDEFQSYDHYLPHYWEYRTSRYIFVDKVGKGGSTIEVSWVSEWKLDPLPEFRAWYAGQSTVAQYHGNYAPRFKTEGPGTYDQDHNRTGDGVQYKFTYTIASAIPLDGKEVPLAVGQFMEIEISQFLDAVPTGRDNYYGTVFLYEVGKGGMVPWYAVGTFTDKASERENSHKIDEKGWLGGRTTLSYQYSDEPDNHFMQMATNLADLNAQPFVRGRRVHHTHMTDGIHDESAENGTFDALKGLAGPNYVNVSCDSCHTRNGRAPVADIGVPLTKWVFKVAAADGGKDPLIGSVLQPSGINGSPGEGTVSIGKWVTNAEGLRSPEYAFAKQKPALFSARIAPQLVGLGLLEAVPETTVLALQDVDDQNGDGISGKIQVSIEPVTGIRRLGRFGWKAGASSLRHQVAAALNTDMGVMTSVLPNPDCGAMEQGCGNDQGAELPDQHFDDLVKYVHLLGVRARRNLNDADALRGETVFNQLGCPSCHVAELKTTKFHPLAELRDQTIHPYTDLLLHDMGPGLADNLGEGQASGAEWRTTPLWGLGLSACVVGGVSGPAQKQVCTPHDSYLHDGRARTIEEAILWHDGEGRKSKDAYAALPAADKAALLKFLESL
ncbi:MAG TPA: di-heme oxidoredictase family protein [Polyangiaceae bacterium]|nr:di-heme oxidoredictase family protein [Polyangiaceae bacterium]